MPTSPRANHINDVIERLNHGHFVDDAERAERDQLVKQLRSMARYSGSRVDAERRALQAAYSAARSFQFEEDL